MHRSLLSTLSIAGMLLILLLITWLAYQPAINSSLQFDDRPNLENLAQIESGIDKLSFLLDGRAGPLGRPVSLATFALQHDFWPTAIPVLFQTNIVLHLLSGLAVFFLAAGLARALQMEHARWVSLLSCGLFLLSPFLASTQLLLVQRMTTLAGLFVFVGLASYVWGRLLYQNQPRLGATLMVLALTAGTALAALSKENGALLPVLALVIELTLLRHTELVLSNKLKRALYLLMGIPAALIGVYLASRAPGLFDNAGFRDFTPMQRFASQPVILLEYLKHLLVPATTGVTPFGDDRQAADGWAETIVIASSLAWLMILLIAVFIRNKTPLLLFAVFFFLSAHVLESSIINLELYFAHRNYIPAFAVYFTLSALLVSLVSRYKVPGGLGATAYVVSFWIVLFSTTSLWGQPLIAGEIWSKQHPDSMRAQQFLANEYFAIGDRDTAHFVLAEGAMNDQTGVLDTLVLFTCRFDANSREMVSEHAATAEKKIRSGNRVMGLSTVILAVTTNTLEEGCEDLSNRELVALGDALLGNPAYADVPGAMANIFNAKALVALADGDEEGAMRYFLAMYDATRHENHAVGVSELLADRGRYREALDLLRFARTEGPSNPIRRWIRHQVIDGQIKVLEQRRQAVEF